MQVNYIAEEISAIPVTFSTIIPIMFSLSGKSIPNSVLKKWLIVLGVQILDTFFAVNISTK